MDRYLSVSEDYAESDLSFAKSDRTLAGLFFANVDFSTEAVMTALLRLDGHEYRKVTLFNPTGPLFDRALSIILSNLKVDTFVLEYTGTNEAGDHDDDGNGTIFRDRDAQVIGDALSKGSPVKSLCFRGVPRLKSLAEALKTGLRSSKHVESFVWSHRRSFVASLDVESNLDDDNMGIFWKTLTHGLEGCKSLGRLEIRRTERDDVVAPLLMSLRNHPSLRHITICVSNIGSEIQNALEQLCGTKSTDSGVSQLETIRIRIFLRDQLLRVPALPSNGRVKYVLEPWFTGDEHMKIVGAGLSHNVAIDELDLPYHSLSCRGVEMLASWLPRAGNLRKLILEGRLVRQEGAAALLTAMRAKHDSLQLISLPRSCPYRRLIQHYADLNRAGSTRLQRDPFAPLSLWPAVIERADKLVYDHRNVKENLARQANVLYQLLHGSASFGRLQSDDDLPASKS